MKRITLLIDDDPATNLIHKRLIESVNSDENLLIFEEGKEAYSFVERVIQEIDIYNKVIVLLDLRMPDTDGYEILDVLEECEEDYSDRIIVYVLTNDHGLRVDEKISRYTYVNSIIRKPINEMTLENILAKN